MRFLYQNEANHNFSNTLRKRDKKRITDYFKLCFTHNYRHIQSNSCSGTYKDSVLYTDSRGVSLSDGENENKLTKLMQIYIRVNMLWMLSIITIRLIDRCISDET